MLTIALVLASLSPQAAEKDASAFFRVYELPLDAPGLRMVAAELDGQGGPDVAVVTRPSADQVNLLTFAGTGTGRLQPDTLHVLQQLGYTNTPTLTADDLNGDGLTDMGISTVSGGSVFLGDGDLSYDPTGFFPSAGGTQLGLDFTDVDGDGDKDSVLMVLDIAGYFLDIGLNTGTGSFTDGGFVSAPGSSVFGTRLVFADLDGNGVESTVVSSWGGLATSPWPDGPDTAVPLLPATLEEVVVVRLDGDAFPDIATAATADGGVYVLVNDGSGGFPTSTFFPTGNRPESLAAGDIDLDGLPDLAVANRLDGTVALLQGDGAGGFAPALTLDVAADPVDLELTDLDADGDLDVVVTGGSSALLTVALNRVVP